MPHTDVLAQFANRLEDQVIELMQGEGALQAAANAAPQPTEQAAISNEAPAGGVQTSGLMGGVQKVIE